MIEPRFLLDSNICIYLVKGVSGTVRARLEEYAPGEVVTSALVFAEVTFGLGQAATGSMREFFEMIEVKPFDRAAGEVYAAIPFKRGRLDRLIGAHAVALGLTLVTNNEADFLDIPGLRIENWTLPPA